MNNFPKNQDTFKKTDVMSGNSTSNNEGTYRNKSNKIFLIGGSHLNRINKKISGKDLKEIGLVLNVSLELIQNS